MIIMILLLLSIEANYYNELGFEPGQRHLKQSFEMSEAQRALLESTK